MSWAFSPLLPGAAHQQAASATYTLVADAGIFALAGQGANILHNYALTADAGLFALAGQDVTITPSGGTPPPVARQASIGVAIGVRL